MWRDLRWTGGGCPEVVFRDRPLDPSIPVTPLGTRKPLNPDFATTDVRPCAGDELGGFL